MKHWLEFYRFIIIFYFDTLLEAMKSYSGGFILYFILLLIQLIPIIRDFDIYYI